MFFFFQAEDGIRDIGVTGVQDVCSSDLKSNSVSAKHNYYWNVSQNQNLIMIKLIIL